MTCCGAAPSSASRCPPPSARSSLHSWRAGRDRRVGVTLPYIRRRGAEVAAEGAVEIGDVVEAAGMRELCDGQVRIARIAQHAAYPCQPLAEHEGREGAS